MVVVTFADLTGLTATSTTTTCTRRSRSTAGSAIVVAAAAAAVLPDLDLEQFLMRSLFDLLALLHHHDSIAVLNRRQSMRYNDCHSLMLNQQLIQSFLHYLFATASIRMLSRWQCKE